MPTESDEEKRVHSRLQAAKARLVAAFNLLKKGNLTPEEQQEVKQAKKEADAANRDMRNLLKAMKARNRNTAA